MKALVTLVIGLLLFNSSTAQDNQSLYFHASVGLTQKIERVYELELGIKGPDTKLFFSVPAGIYTARLSNDERSHVYYGIRANYLVYLSEMTAIGPIASYLRHNTAEGLKMNSNDYDIGVRFYRFSLNQALTAAAWTITARYISTKANNYDKFGNTELTHVNKFVLSVGIHGLF